MVDGQKPQALLETLNVTNQDLYPNIYAIFTVLIAMLVSSASSERSIFLNISSKVVTLSLGLEPDIFTLQANRPTTVLLAVNDNLVNVSIHF
jgi:hypothetical protein